MKTEFVGNIQNIREIEDSIRASKKYTKGAFSRAPQHPIQGEQFPSKVLVEYYEVYPYTKVDWSMPIDTAIQWLAGVSEHIDVVFKYDYRRNRASMTVHGGNNIVNELKNEISGFGKALAKAILDNYEHNKMGIPDRNRNCVVPNPQQVVNRSH